MVESFTDKQGSFLSPLALIFMLWLTVSCNVCAVVHYLVPPVSVSSGLKGDFCPVHHVVCLINTNMAGNYAHSRYQVCMLSESSGMFCAEFEAISYVIFHSILAPPRPPSTAHSPAALWWCSAGCCQVWAGRRGKCSAGSPLHICWPGLGSKKKKITVGTRCTTHHLLHPIRPLTQNSWANISAIFHDWTSGKCHMGSSLYWSWQMYGRNKVYYFTFRLVLWSCVGTK